MLTFRVSLIYIFLICGQSQLSWSQSINSVSKASSEKPPHIILIMADDLGWNDVGYHSSEIQTPNIDRLAREGVALDRFYAHPTCSPSRAALMTGKSPKRFGISYAIGKNQTKGLPLDEKILPQYLNEAGYRSLMIGKWHLGGYIPDYLPHNRGFEYFYGFINGGIGYWDHNTGGGHDWQRNGLTVREEGYATHLQIDDAIKLIQGHESKQPMFLYVAMAAPHLPNEAPKESISLYKHLENSNRRVHAAMTHELDVGIGRIINALEDKGIVENTLLFFFSDNGGLLQGDVPAFIKLMGRIGNFFFDRPIPFRNLEFFAMNTCDGGSDNSPLQGGKGSVSEGGVRVPAVIWWPDKLAPGRYEQFMTVSDVLPTLLDLISGKIPTDLDGVSHWGGLTRDENIKTPDYLMVSFDDTALFRWPWKLTSPDEPKLFNIANDPLEQDDLSNGNPEIVASMVATINTWPSQPELGINFFKAFFDMDSFGGEEDREPWAEAAIRNANNNKSR